MLTSIRFAVAALIIGMISTAASAQPFRDRGYHPDRHYHREHSRFYRHAVLRHDVRRR